MDCCMVCMNAHICCIVGSLAVDHCRRQVEQVVERAVVVVLAAQGVDPLSSMWHGSMDRGRLGEAIGD